MAMTEEQARIRGYLTAQGTKLSPAELIEKVRLAMGELRTAVTSVAASRFSDRPAAEDWSANEVMAHVVTTGARFAERITRILDGGASDSAVADSIEAGVPRRTAEEWLTQFESDRASLFDRVLHAQPDANLDRTITHPFFGPLNWRETLLFTRLHDLDHAGQLGKIAVAFGATPPPGASPR